MTIVVLLKWDWILPLAFGLVYVLVARNAMNRDCQAVTTA